MIKQKARINIGTIVIFYVMAIAVLGLAFRGCWHHYLDLPGNI